MQGENTAGDTQDTRRGTLLLPIFGSPSPFAPRGSMNLIRPYGIRPESPLYILRLLYRLSGHYTIYIYIYILYKGAVALPLPLLTSTLGSQAFGATSRLVGIGAALELELETHELCIEYCWV